MPGSDKKNALIPRPIPEARLDLFRLRGVRIARRRPAPHIYAKHVDVARWPFVVVLVTALVVLLLSAYADASSPQSRGARPLAVGNGYTAVSGDAYSLFYNPAGLYDLNQQELAVDYGRLYSPKEGAGSDFNGIFATPYRWHDMPMPIAVGVYGEGPAPGTHIVDVTGGAAIDTPIENLTHGIIKRPVRAGVALTIRHQQGDDRSVRVGKSNLTMGLTGGLLMPINRQHQIGFSIRNLFPPGGDRRGPSLHLGVLRHQNENLDLFGDMEFDSGGIWRFHPGAEFLLARGVVRPRIGWGFNADGGIGQVATGIGFYLSPFQIDVTYLVPTRTINDNAGQFRTSLVYRFGRPQFSEIYYDHALEQASELDKDVLTMTVKEAELKSSLSEVEQKRRLAFEELDNIKKRIEALKDQDVLGQRDATIRDLKARVQELESQVSAQRSEVRSLRRPEPRIHVVVAGETLQSIARQYYGDPNQWKRIYSANADKIDRGLPRPGSRLVIP